MAQDAITKINKYAATAAIIAAFASGIFTLYASQVIADHNDKDNAHPATIAQIELNKAQIQLLDQRGQLIQERNDDAHERIEKAQERMEENQTDILKEIRAISLNRDD